MRQLTTEAETTAAAPGQTPDAEAALVAVSALDPKTTGKQARVPLLWSQRPAGCAKPPPLPGCWHPFLTVTVHAFQAGPRLRSLQIRPLFFAEVMLEEEVRQAVISTAGTAAGGPPCHHSCGR